MIELTKCGVGRQEAHGQHFKDVLLENAEVMKYLSEDDIMNFVDPDRYIGTAVEQVEAVVAKL